MKLSRRNCGILILGGAITLSLVLWLWIRSGASSDQAAPDHYDFATVYSGTTLEFSAKLLAYRDQSWLDRAFDSLLRHLPSSWRPVLGKIHPRKLRSPAPKVPLDTLKPSIEVPSFLQVTSLQPEQRAAWYANRPFFVAHFKLDTSRLGPHAGEIKIALDSRRASLPVRFTVLPPPTNAPRLLITESPFDAYSTDHGSQLYPTSQLISSLGCPVDVLQNWPLTLDPYQVILIAESALARLDTNQVPRLNAFVARGGRLILCCSYFYRGTVNNANLILEDNRAGLHIIDQDYGRQTPIENIADHPLTKQVRRLMFFRPSQIQVTDPNKASILGFVSNQQDGLVAVSRLPGGGQIIVLGIALWWNWIQEFKDQSDNLQLMRNFLEPRPAP